MSARTQPHSTFAEWLAQRRRALDLTQEQLAGQVGCSVVTLRKLESADGRPSRQIAERLAEVLQISAGERAAFLLLAQDEPDDAAADGLSAIAVEPLTRREREMLALLNQGFSAPEIALQLTLAVSSVKWHIQHLYSKLGVNTKRQALTRAAELGLLGSAAAAAPAVVPAAPSEAPEPGESPFKGLLYFDEADANLFFGREALVEKLVGRLAPEAGAARNPTRFLAVVGASGSGKSSIVRAGLIPALRVADGAGPGFDPIHVITPTAHPLESLAASLTRDSESVTAMATLMDDLGRDTRALHLHLRRWFYGSDGPARATTARRRVLLVVDQFEELFTLCRSEPERRAFIENLMLATAPQTDRALTVVITLRADFYSACAPYPELRDMLANFQEYIGPMSAAELRQAIEQPAALGRWEFAPGLVDLILRDVGDEPGALPLLSHALLETWQHRRGRTLTLKSYAEAGRVQGAIATTAEAVFQSMAPDEQDIARGIFLRLTELGEGTQDTRRRVALAELVPAGAEANGGPGSATAGVLETLSNSRLITKDDVAVEVAHEALIREWPTLRGWLDEDREALRLHRHLTEAAQEWDEANRDPSELYRGPRLVQASDWESNHPGELNLLERDFLETSQAYAEREAAEREAQTQRDLEAAQALAEAQSQRAEAEHQRAAEHAQAATRLRGRNRIITGVGVVALLAAVVAGFTSFFASQNAGLAVAANTQSAQHLSTAQAAGTQAVDQLVIAEHQATLAFANQLAAQAISVLPENLSLSLLLGVEARRTADTAHTRATQLRIFQYSPHLLAFVRGHRNYVQAVAFSPLGDLLATGSVDSTIRFWNVADYLAADIPLNAGTFPVRSLAFSPDGQLLAAGGQDGNLHLWDLASGQPVGQAIAGHLGNVTSVAFSPDGRTLASGSSDRTILLSDVASGEPVTGTLTGHSQSVTGVVFSPDGQTLASSSSDGTLRLWDAESGQALGVPMSGSLTAFTSIAFSPDGKLVAAGSSDNFIYLWHLGDPLRADLEPLGSHAEAVTSVAFSPNGRQLASASADGTLQLWDTVNQQGVGEPFIGHGGPLLSVAFSPDGQRLATGSADHAVALWQLSSDLTRISVKEWPELACEIAGRNLTPSEWTTYFAAVPYRKTCEQWPDGGQ